MVLHIDGYYNLASQYLKCSACCKRYISWSNTILDQLDAAHCSHFPALLTYKLVIHLCTELVMCLEEFPQEQILPHDRQQNTTDSGVSIENKRAKTSSTSPLSAGGDRRHTQMNLNLCVYAVFAKYTVFLLTQQLRHC